IHAGERSGDLYVIFVEDDETATGGNWNWNEGVARIKRRAEWTRNNGHRRNDNYRYGFLNSDAPTNPDRNHRALSRSDSFHYHGKIRRAAHFAAGDRDLKKSPNPTVSEKRVGFQ